MRAFWISQPVEAQCAFGPSAALAPWLQVDETASRRISIAQWACIYSTVRYGSY